MKIQLRLFNTFKSRPVRRALPINTNSVRGDEKNINGMVSLVGGKNQCRTTSETRRCLMGVKYAERRTPVKYGCSEGAKRLNETA